MTKRDLTRKALVEIEENLEIGIIDYAVGICWFMYHAEFWTFSTMSLVIEKVTNNKTPSLEEVMNWEEKSLGKDEK